MKKRIINLILILILLAGLSLLLYPTVSDYWNSFHSSRAVGNYADEVASIDNEEYDAILESAKRYNENLLEKKNQFVMDDEELLQYDQELRVSGTEVIGIVEIPSINVSIPIYHGTSDAVLQIAVGHVEWSSLPVGGESTHAVLSGHRGLPSAKLFTDLDDMKKGDIFLIHVLDETLTYEVDQILIVEPDEVSDLQIIEGEDLCTLVTCTPYGINTHRLLVRGHRVETAADYSNIRVASDAAQVEPLLVALFLAIPILIILILIVILKPAKRKK